MHMNMELHTVLGTAFFSLTEYLQNFHSHFSTKNTKKIALFILLCCMTVIPQFHRIGCLVIARAYGDAHCPYL